MVQAIVLLALCIVVIVMFAIFYSLWDILTGRWSERKRMQQEIEDKDEFDNS